MPANKYADPYINAAYERMVAAVQDLSPPSFSMEPTSEQFEDAAKHLKDLAHAVDEYLSKLVREADSNARSHIGNPSALISSAMHDCGLIGELESEASDLAEDEDHGRGDYAEHNTMHRAYQGV